MFKFNNGIGSITCDVCSIVIKENCTSDDAKDIAAKDGKHYCNNHKRNTTATISEPVTISQLRRGDVFYEKGILGIWAKFIAYEDGGNKTFTDGIGQQFQMESIVVKVLDVSHGDFSRIGSIVKFENDTSLEGNRGPRLFRKCTEEKDGKLNQPLQGDWRKIQ